MSFANVEESIHERAGFMLAAIVWSNTSLNEQVAAALRRAGLSPSIDEFKSSAPMAGDPQRQVLRDELRDLLLRHCRIAVAVCGTGERKQIGKQVTSLVRDLDVRSGSLFIDAGIRTSGAGTGDWLVHANCDSRTVLGLQLADCAAHTIASILLVELGLVDKKVPTADPLYAPSIELDFKLWASIRYALAGRPMHDDVGADDWEPTMHPFGLSISSTCPASVAAAAEKRLGAVLGTLKRP